MEHTGFKSYLAIMCALYVYLLNQLTMPDLQWCSSHEVCFGVTPDTSALLLFTFNECIYYLDAEILFPDSKEKTGPFVGITENVGDALTF